MRRSTADLDKEVAALGDLSREQLGELWQKAHGHPPPKGIRQELLLRSATWHLQAKRLGGLRPDTRRLLKAAMADAGKKLSMTNSTALPRGRDVAFENHPIEKLTSASASASDAGVEPTSTKMQRSVSPGARLVRDWNGKTHVVDVIEEGFVFQAKVYQSLTAIARQITGAHWSGPRFFGL